MAITRSTASSFPVNTQGTGTTTSSSVTLGGAGEIVIVSISINGAATVTGVTNTGVALSWTRAEQNYISSTDSETWYAVVPAAAAGQSCTVSFTASASVSSIYCVIVIDDFISGYGANTRWGIRASGGTYSASGVTTALTFPNLTTGPQAVQAYYGAIFFANVGSSGVTPVNGAAFTYTYQTSTMIAFSSAVAANTSYQPQGTQSTTATSASAGIIFYAVPVPTVVQQGDDGTAEVGVASGTSHAVLPSNTGIGHGVILNILTNTAGTTLNDVTSVSSPIGTFVKLVSVSSSVPQLGDSEIWYCASSTGAANTVTITTSDSAAWFCQAIELNVPVIGAYAGQQVVSASSSGQTISVTPNNINDLIYSFNSSYNNVASGFPGGVWTRYTSTESTTLTEWGTPYGAIAYLFATSSATQSATWTPGTTGNNQVVLSAGFSFATIPSTVLTSFMGRGRMGAFLMGANKGTASGTSTLPTANVQANFAAVLNPPSIGEAMPVVATFGASAVATLKLPSANVAASFIATPIFSLPLPTANVQANFLLTGQSTTPSITPVGSPVVLGASLYTTMTVTPTAIGNCLILHMVAQTALGTPSGGGCTWVKIADTGNNSYAGQMWLGTITTTGPQYITTTVGCEMWCQEFTAGGPAQWSSPGGAATTLGSGLVNMPSPPLGGGTNFYMGGTEFQSGGVSNGNSTGFAYTGVWDPTYLNSAVIMYSTTNYIGTPPNINSGNSSGTHVVAYAACINAVLLPVLVVTEQVTEGCVATFTAAAGLGLSIAPNVQGSFIATVPSIGFKITESGAYSFIGAMLSTLPLPTANVHGNFIAVAGLALTLPVANAQGNFIGAIPSIGFSIAPNVQGSFIATISPVLAITPTAIFIFTGALSPPGLGESMNVVGSFIAATSLALKLPTANVQGNFIGAISVALTIAPSGVYSFITALSPPSLGEPLSGVYSFTGAIGLALGLPVTNGAFTYTGSIALALMVQEGLVAIFTLAPGVVLGVLVATGNVTGTFIAAISPALAIPTAAVIVAFIAVYSPEAIGEAIIGNYTFIAATPSIGFRITPNVQANFVAATSVALAVQEGLIANFIVGLAPEAVGYPMNGAFTFIAATPSIGFMFIESGVYTFIAAVPSIGFQTTVAIPISFIATVPSIGFRITPNVQANFVTGYTPEAIGYPMNGAFTFIMAETLTTPGIISSASVLVTFIATVPSIGFRVTQVVTANFTASLANLLLVVTPTAVFTFIAAVPSVGFMFIESGTYTFVAAVPSIGFMIAPALLTSFIAMVPSIGFKIVEAVTATFTAAITAITNVPMSVNVVASYTATVPSIGFRFVEPGAYSFVASITGGVIVPATASFTGSFIATVPSIGFRLTQSGSYPFVASITGKTIVPETSSLVVTVTIAAPMVTVIPETSQLSATFIAHAILVVVTTSGPSNFTATFTASITAYTTTRPTCNIVAATTIAIGGSVQIQSTGTIQAYWIGGLTIVEEFISGGLTAYFVATIPSSQPIITIPHIVMYVTNRLVTSMCTKSRSVTLMAVTNRQVTTMSVTNRLVTDTIAVNRPVTTVTTSSK